MYGFIIYCSCFLCVGSKCVWLGGIYGRRLIVLWFSRGFPTTIKSPVCSCLFVLWFSRFPLLMLWSLVWYVVWCLWCHVCCLICFSMCLCYGFMVGVMVFVSICVCVFVVFVCFCLYSFMFVRNGLCVYGFMFYVFSVLFHVFNVVVVFVLVMFVLEKHIWTSQWNTHSQVNIVGGHHSRQNNNKYVFLRELMVSLFRRLWLAERIYVITCASFAV